MQDVLLDAETKVNISTNLQRMLASTGVSQRELSRRTGDAPMTINEIVNGKTMPGVGVLSRIAEALEVTIDELLATPKKISRHSAKSA